MSAADELSGIAASLLLCEVSSVISTLWRVPDDSSLELMTHFYENVSMKCARKSFLIDAENQQGVARGDRDILFALGQKRDRIGVNKATRLKTP